MRDDEMVYPIGAERWPWVAPYSDEFNDAFPWAGTGLSGMAQPPGG